MEPRLRQATPPAECYRPVSHYSSVAPSSSMNRLSSEPRTVEVGDAASSSFNGRRQVEVFFGNHCGRLLRRIQQREVPGQNVLLLGGQFLQGQRPDADLRLLVGVEAGAGGHEVAENHVLFQPEQLIDLAGQGRFGQHLGGFLEAGGRDEAVALHGRLGDAEQLRAGGGHLRLDALGRRAAEGLDLGVRLLQYRQRARSRPARNRCRPSRRSSGTWPTPDWRRGTRTCPSRCRAAGSCRRSTRRGPSAASGRR